MNSERICSPGPTSSPEAFGEQPEMPLRNDSESLFSAAEKHGRHSYGASKYLGEILVQHAVKEHSLDARIVRPFNGYGPRLPGDSYGQVTGIFLKQCHTGETITIHGDGEQTRSFLYIDDCVEGTLRLFDSDHVDPINIGSDEQVSINQLVDVVENISKSNLKLNRNYQLDKPLGVRGRSSNNDKLKEVLKWNYTIKLEEGMKKTYDWIYESLSGNDPSIEKFTKSELK